MVNAQTTLLEERAQLVRRVAALELRLQPLAKGDLRRPKLLLEKAEVTKRLTEIRCELAGLAADEQAYRRARTLDNLESPDGLIHALRKALLDAYPVGALPAPVEEVLLASRAYLEGAMALEIEEEQELRAS